MKLLSAFAMAAVFAIGRSQPVGAQSLLKFASLPADTLAPGPTSGQLIAPANGHIPPFVGKQPVQGFSSVLQTEEGDYLAISDNGFGAKPNSPDYVLRFFRIDPDFRTPTRRLRHDRDRVVHHAERPPSTKSTFPSSPTARTIPARRFPWTTRSRTGAC